MPSRLSLSSATLTIDKVVPDDPAATCALNVSNEDKQISTVMSSGKTSVRMLVKAVLLAIAIACHPAKGVCEAPVNADSIVDSVGVNIHLHHGDTIYGNFPLIQGLLKNLGVRHARDGMIDTTWQPYYERHIALGQLGIKSIFITNPVMTDAVLTSWPSRIPGAFEGYEAPNEYDNSKDPNWSATLNAFVPRLYKAVKSNRNTAAFPVIGPSLIRASDFAPISGLSAYFDFSNMHNYFGGHHPGTPGWGDNGYGSITYNMNLEQTGFPGKPIFTTETGYYTDVSIGGGVPEGVEGKYVPRMILEQTLHGITRTYIYELIDEGKGRPGAEGSFGLARLDGSEKPAFTALRNLITILADPGPSIRPQNLQFSLQGGSANVHHLLMAKRDGSYYLAFWLEEKNYDGVTHQETPSKPQNVTFNSKRIFPATDVITFGADGSAKTRKLAPSATIALTVTDTVTILRLK